MMNRRTSLRSIAIGGIVPMFLPARLFGQSGPNERINMAAIGCGRMGQANIHTNLHAELTLPDEILIKIKCDAKAQAGVRFIGSEAWAHAWRGKFEASNRDLLREPKGAEPLLVVSKDHHGNWLESIRSRKDPVAPVEAGHLTNNLCVGTLAAGKAAGGKELTWDQAKEEFQGNPEVNAILNL